MQDYKILVVGSSGSGKTTAISTISEIDVVNTDVFNSDYKNLNKEMTTVGLDYGEVTFPALQGGKLRLYGAPGQQRFSFVWQALASGVAGIVLLADNSQEDPLGELQYYLQSFKMLLSGTKKNVLLGIVKTDISPVPDKAAYQQLLETFGVNAPVVILDAREYESVQTMLLILSEQLLKDNHGRMGE